MMAALLREVEPAPTRPGHGHHSLGECLDYRQKWGQFTCSHATGVRAKPILLLFRA